MIRIIKGKHLFIIKSIIKTAVNMQLEIILSMVFIKTSKCRSKNLFFTNFGKKERNENNLKDTIRISYVAKIKEN